MLADDCRVILANAKLRPAPSSAICTPSPCCSWFALVPHAAVQLGWRGAKSGFVEAHAGTVPAGFATVISPAEHAKAAAYTVATQRLGMIETVSTGSDRAGPDRWRRHRAASATFGRGHHLPSLSGTLHVLGVFAVMAASLRCQFSVYRTFVLEQRFGFNRTRPAVFLTDQLKGWTLGLVLGAAITACVLWIMASAGDGWWIVAWVAWMCFSLLVTWAWPRLIAPLFNSFSPLDDTALRRRIDALLDRCDFHAKSVFVMDGSSARRTAMPTSPGSAARSASCSSTRC